MKSSLGLGLLLIAVALVALLLHDDPSGAPGSDATEAEPAGAATARADEANGADKGPGLSAAGSAKALAAESPPDYRLSGIVRNAAGTPVRGARLVARLRALGESEDHMTLRGATDAGGHYDLDLSPAFGADALIASVSIEVSHPQYCPESRHVSVMGADRMARTRRWARDFDFAPTARAEGQLLDPTGAPVRGEVRLFASTRYGAPNPTVRRRATDATGRFLVPARLAGNYRLAAQAPGLAPVVVPVIARMEPPFDVGAITLDHGATVEGVIHINNEPAPRLRFRLACADIQRKQYPMGPHGGVLSHARGVARWHAVGQTDAEGRFTVGGLAETRYRMHIGHADSFVVALHTWKLHGLAVSVPDTRAKVAFTGTWADVLVQTAEGLPLADQPVEVEKRKARTDERGRLRILLPRAEILTVGVRQGRLFGSGSVRDGKASVRLRTPLGPPGLSPEEARSAGTLRLDLRGAGAQRVDVVGVVATRRIDEQQMERHSWTLRHIDGALRTPPLPAGDWRVEVRPGSAWDGLEGTWLPIRQNVHIAKGMETVLGSNVRPGARLRIRVRAEDGLEARTNFKLLDASGRAHEVSIHTEAQRSPFLSHSLQVGGPRGIVEPALPPGTYRLEIASPWGGHLPAQRSVTLTAGQTKDVDIWVERKP